MTSVLLCDADGNLFPSEEPAFVASAEVTNAFLASLGIDRRYEAEELRLATTGKNFRTTAADLAAAAGLPVDPATLDTWVREEQRVVTARLAQALRPDARVREPLGRLAGRFRLAAVSSSAAARLDACFAATGLDDLIPAPLRFSAEDSLPEPRSKPDPAIYAFAGQALGAAPADAVAIEDSLPGVQSAVAAGFRVLGNLLFVAAAERAERARALVAAGALGVMESWEELEGRLAEPLEQVAEHAVDDPLRCVAVLE
jgi:beta-phosphoglucomutase-like phosphatase (HAD superfamily)